MLLTFLASFTVFIFARYFSIWLTFVMHLWSRFSSVVWKIYRYFNVLHSFLCLRYWRCAEMSRRRIARVELALRRIVPSPSWPRRIGRVESAAPSCPIMCLHAHAYLRNHVFKLHQIFGACCLLLWLGRYYDTLCTSGFVDDAILAHQSQAYGDAKKACTDTQGGSQKASRIWHRGVEVYSNWLIRGNIAAGGGSLVSQIVLL